MRGLAEGLELGRRTRVSDGRDVAELRFDCGRAEEHVQPVLPFAHGLRHVERMRDEHVRRLADLHAVHEDVAERVQSVELEHGLLVRQDGATGEVPRIEPLVALELPGGVLVVRPEEVRQQARGAEVELVAARDLRRNRHFGGWHIRQRTDASARGRRPAPQAPVSIERQHRRGEKC